jgi:hypothetical protein
MPLHQRHTAQGAKEGAGGDGGGGWEGPLLSGVVQQQGGELRESAARSGDNDDSDDSDVGDFPTAPHNAEDDRVIYSAALSFLGSLVVCIMLPFSGKLVSLLGFSLFLLGCVVVIFLPSSRGALPLELGVGFACGSLGLMVGGLLQEVLRYSLLEVGFLPAVRALLRALNASQ